MPGLGRQSIPVPNPVFVTRLRTGQLLSTIGQRPAARFAARSALGADDGQVVRIPVRVVPERQSRVQYQRPPVAAGRFIAARCPAGSSRQATGRCTPGRTCAAGSSSALAR